MQLLAIAMARWVLPVPVPPTSTVLRCWAMCKREAELQAEVDGWLQAAEAADAAEDKAFGADRRGDEMPDWVADKQARLAKIRQAKARLCPRARASAGD